MRQVARRWCCVAARLRLVEPRASDESALTHSATSLSGDTYSVRHPGDVMTRHRAGLLAIRLSISVTTVLPRATGTAPVGGELSGRKQGVGKRDAWGDISTRRRQRGCCA
jgi:hypothetical protein